MTDKASKTSGKREKETSLPDGNTTASKPKREKRRREDPVEENITPAVNEPEQTLQEPQKKKRKKNKTGFPDPQDDSSLSEQALKALSYAFSQFRKPSKWKFSKARQNWLTRNWSDMDVIPDIYLPLTIQYLSYVKGGVRETLIKDCQTILSASPDKLTSTETTSDPVDITQVVSKTDELKVARARSLLDALEASDSQADHPK
ncbi:hypothetical protein FB451DRAFT_1204531 [Mycena latifolia]|nr:hypothetical protein FB451DRAFT_1204531 [Mycena latifolia]